MRRAAFALAGALALAGAACAAGGGAPEPAPVAPSAARSLPPLEGTVGDLFGVNEAVAIPRARLDALDDAGRAAFVDERIALVKALGVRHVRVHSASWPFLNATNPDRADADAFLAAVIGAGLEPLVMIGPWPGNAPAAVTERYVPDDLAAYAAWVTATVERYDGDGTDDAPGLGKGVRAWEIDNEPDLHNRVPPRGPKGTKAPRGSGSPEDFETPAEYAEVARVTLDAIRAADPGALVLPAGLYAPAGGPGAVYAAALWGDAAFADRFDATNTHAYPPTPAEVWAGPDRLADVAPGRRLWITEVSVGDDLGEPAQAAFLAGLYLDALDRGVARVYWHSLREPPAAGGRAGPRPTEGHHLYVGEPPRPKLAALTLQRLVAVWGAVPRADVAPVPAEGARALRIGEDLVVWGGEAAVPVDARGELAAERLVPDAVSGAAQGDTPPLWTLPPVPVQDAHARVDARVGPVRVLAAFPRKP